jgi:hypothetical protein
VGVVVEVVVGFAAVEVVVGFAAVEVVLTDVVVEADGVVVDETEGAVVRSGVVVVVVDATG